MNRIAVAARESCTRARMVAALASAFLPCIATTAYVQGDGPRAYQVVPNATTQLTVYGMSLEGNQTADPGVVIRGGDIFNLAF